MKRLALALLFAAALISSAAAQVPPPTLPANTLWGRLGIGSGPGQAIPLGTVGARLFGCNTVGSFIVSTGTTGQCSDQAGAAGFLAGGFQISPTPNTLGQGFNIFQSLPTTGNQTGPFSANIISTTNLGYILTGTGLDSFGILQNNLTPFRVNYTASNNGVSGAIHYGGIFAVQTAANPNGEFVGMMSSVYNNLANANGNLWGAIAHAQVDASGTISKIVGHATELGVTTGGTATYRIGDIVISEGPVQGSTLDAAFVASAINVGFGNGAGWKKLIAVSNQFGLAPLDTSADFFFSDSAITVTNFANLGNVFVTGAVLKFNHINLPGAPSSDFVLPTHNPGAFQFGSLVAAGVAVEIDAFTGPALFMGKRADTSSTAPSAVQANEVVTGISAQAYDGSGYHEIAGFSFRAQDTQTTTDHGSVIVFLTTPTTASAAEQQVGFVNASAQWFFGTATATVPSGPVLVASKNTATTLPSLSSTVQIYDVDANSTVFDLFGASAAANNANQIRLFASRGTIASPTAIQSGDVLGSWVVYGYGGAYRQDSGAGISSLAAENFTSTTAGQHLDIYTTPTGTHAIARAGRWNASGGLSVGTTGDGGAGVVNVLTGFRIGKSAASGNVLRGNGTNFVSAQLAAADLSNGTAGSGAVALATTPTFVTNITVPLINGGSGAASTLTLASTSGAGTTDRMFFETGSQVIAGYINTAQQWYFGGTSLSLPAGPLVFISSNTGAVPSGSIISGTKLLVTNADGSTARVEVISAAAGGGTINFLGSQGTVASPTATQSGDQLGANFAAGYGTSFQTAGGAGFVMFAAENFDGTHGGTLMDVDTTPAGTVNAARSARFQASGGLSIGATTDPGTGGLFVNGATITFNGLATDNTHTDRTVCQDTTSKSLFFGSGAAGICLGTSSEKFKHGIEPLKVGLRQILAMRPVEYYLNADHGDPDHLLYGFTAQREERNLPDLVGHDRGGKANTFDYMGVVPVLVKAVQELKHDNDNLRANNDNLRTELAEVKRAISR